MWAQSLYILLLLHTSHINSWAQSYGSKPCIKLGTKSEQHWWSFNRLQNGCSKTNFEEHTNDLWIETHTHRLNSTHFARNTHIITLVVLRILVRLPCMGGGSRMGGPFCTTGISQPNVQKDCPSSLLIWIHNIVTFCLSLILVSVIYSSDPTLVKQFYLNWFVFTLFVWPHTCWNRWWSVTIISTLISFMMSSHMMSRYTCFAQITTNMLRAMEQSIFITGLFG